MSSIIIQKTLLLSSGAVPQSTSIGFQVTEPSLPRSSLSSFSMSSSLISKLNTSMLERMRSEFSDLGRGTKLGTPLDISGLVSPGKESYLCCRDQRMRICAGSLPYFEETSFSCIKKMYSFTLFASSCRTGFPNAPLTKGVYAWTTMLCERQ